jgi:hypothetical protein
MDSELRAAEHSGDAFKRAVQLQRAGQLEDCADTLEQAWLGGDLACGDALFHFLDEWRANQAVAVATRLDRLACAGNDRARAAWKLWFPDLGAIVGTSENMRGLRRVVLEQAARPRDSVLILRGGSGVGKRTAARVLDNLVKGSQFFEREFWSVENKPEIPPEMATLYLDALHPGPWEARCVRDCRARNARLVVGYSLTDTTPQWQTLRTLDHVDYFITPLDERREDIRDLVMERFRDWALRGEPEFDKFKTINVQPEAIAELSRRRHWHGGNVRGVFRTLWLAADTALRASNDPDTLTIGVEHLPRTAFSP